MKTTKKPAPASRRAEPPCPTEYAYKTIEEFEEIVGYKVSGVFRDGWKMARMTNAHLGCKANQ